MEETAKPIKDGYERSRVLYILEAAFEYFISLMVEGAYLAKVTTSIGISDSVTGILTSFVSLGCGFQIVAVFLANKRPVKRWVTILHTVNQLFFALVYVVPFIHVPQSVKIAGFIVLLLAGHAVNNIVNSPKINWYMDLVDDKKRGGFTAKKEIVSLMGGMVFSFAIGQIIDRFEAAGDVNSAFIFCGIGIFALALLHTLTLVLSKEKPRPIGEKNLSAGKMVKELAKDRGLYKIILVAVFWALAQYATTPFYGTYQVKELGFSMTFVALLSALYAVCRAAFSLPLGKFADKYTFSKMLNICFAVSAAGYAVNIFTTPANGKVLYTIYYLCSAVAMAGINSGMVNLIYDYVGHDKRIGGLALKSTLQGFAGFFATLLMSLLVAHIQANGNTFLGMNVYAQQVVSAIGCAIVIGIIIYLNTVVRRMKPRGGSGGIGGNMRVSNQDIPVGAKEVPEEIAGSVSEGFPCRDPFVLLADGKYYFYASGSRRGIRCFVSEDLNTLRGPVWVYEAPEDFHGVKDFFWAPECHYYRGNFYIFTSVFSSESEHRNIAVYRSSSPLGPFEDISDGCVGKPEWDTIDGTFYVDEKGQPWMAFVHEWTSMPDKVGAMCVAKLTEDLAHFAEEPIQIFRATDNVHARNNVTDGPYLYRTASGKLIMIWSNHGEKGYFIAKAYSENGIEGPWKQEEELLFERDIKPAFPHDGGHGMILVTKEGETVLVFHTPNSKKDGLFERLTIAPLVEEDDTIRLK